MLAWARLINVTGWTVTNDLMRNKWLHAAGIIVALSLLVVLCYVLSAVLATLFFAFLVAYVLNPVVDFMERRRIPRPVTIAALVVVAVVVIVSLPVVLVPYVVDQAERLTQPTEQTSDGRLSVWAKHVAEALPLDKMVEYVGWVEPGQTDFDAREVIAERVGSYVKESSLGFLRQHAENLFSAGTRAGSAAAAVFASVWRWLVGFLFFAGNVALFGFVVAYLLNDFHRIIAASKELIPPRWRPRVVDIMTKIDFQVHSFLRGEMVVCLILAVLYSIGFSISGVPFAIPIALVGGISAFVPYVGPMVAVIPALLFALLEYGAAWNVLGVLVTVMAAQALEGNILTPNIVGHQVGLSPLWVILSLMVFATLLGFPGLLLAVPVAAALKVLVVEALGSYKRSSFFGPDVTRPAESAKPSEEAEAVEATDN